METAERSKTMIMNTRTEPYCMGRVYSDCGILPATVKMW